MNIGRIIRLLAGIALIVFGLNNYFHWWAAPYTGEALAFFQQLERTGGGYLLYLAGIIEVAAGLSFIIDRQVPLMAMVLFPVLLLSFLFHLFLEGSGIGITGSRVFLTINVVVLITFRKNYMTILKPTFK